MKKKLESELISIAHRILKLTGKEDVAKMHAEVAQLYEKLTVLKFVQDNFEAEIPTIGNDSSFFGMLEQAFNNNISDNIEIGDKIYVNLDDKDDDGIMEPAIEKIKDMVAFMPDTDKQPHLEDLTADYENLPVFEPVSKTEAEKKSLNDTIKKTSLTVGLNDKIAFTKHLFGGSSADYERVISQLNTFNTLGEAVHFMQNIVKPDYNNWQGKEEFETRLYEILERKF
ncbi:MAG: hypothetical protein ACK5NB_06620 [Flavobacteriaceae bacterium]